MEKLQDSKIAGSVLAALFTGGLFYGLRRGISAENVSSGGISLGVKAFAISTCLMGTLVGLSSLAVCRFFEVDSFGEVLDIARTRLRRDGVSDAEQLEMAELESLFSQESTETESK